jgi:hypothetical protein
MKEVSTRLHSEAKRLPNFASASVNQYVIHVFKAGVFARELTIVAPKTAKRQGGGRYHANIIYIYNIAIIVARTIYNRHVHSDTIYSIIARVRRSLHAK